MKTTTTIRGYAVEVEDELTERVQCWIEKDGFTASLAALQMDGNLTNNGDADMPVAPGIIDQITAWAEANGY